MNKHNGLGGVCQSRCFLAGGMRQDVVEKKLLSSDPKQMIFCR